MPGGQKGEAIGEQLRDRLEHVEHLPLCLPVIRAPDNCQLRSPHFRLPCLHRDRSSFHGSRSDRITAKDRTTDDRSRSSPVA